MFRRFVWLAALLFPTVVQAETAAIRGADFGFGNWSGSGYFDVASGQFSHCVISAAYNSGDTLFFSVTQQATVGVGISSPAISFNQGQTVPVAIYVDRRRPFFGTATVTGPGFAMLQIEDFERALETFKRGRFMVVEGGGLRGEYNLDGTFRALNMVLDCALNNYERRHATPQAASTDGDEIDPAVTYQLATSMITDLGISDARYLTASELATLDLSGAVYWISEATGVSGGVTSFDRPADFDVRYADQASTTFLSRDCTGDIASSVRSLQGDVPMRQIRVLCVGGSADYEAVITNAVVDGRQWVTVLRLEGGGSYQPEAPPAELNERLAVHNASYLVEQR